MSSGGHTTSGRAFLDAIDHPVRAKVLTIVAGEAATASAVAAEIDQPVGIVRRHLKYLRERGFVKSRRPRSRGEAEHLLAEDLGIVEDDLYRELTPRERRTVTNFYLQVIVRGITKFVTAGTGFEDHFPLTARITLHADEEIWKHLKQICDRAVDGIAGLHRAARERASSKPQLEATVAILAYERPHPGGATSEGISMKERSRDPTSGEGFVAAISHPIRSKILVRLAHDVASAADLTAEIEEPARTVRYHLNFLREKGFIQVHRSRRRRNMYESSFLSGSSGVVEDDLYERMSVGERRALTQHYLRLLMRGISRFVATGSTYDSHFPYTIRVPLALDEEGWRRLTQVCASLIEQIIELNDADDPRLSDQRNAFEVEIGILALETPLGGSGL